MENVSIKEIRDITIKELLSKDEVVELLDIIYNGIISVAELGYSNLKYHYFKDDYKNILNVIEMLKMSGFTIKHNHLFRTIKINWD